MKNNSTVWWIVLVVVVVLVGGYFWWLSAGSQSQPYGSGSTGVTSGENGGSAGGTGSGQNGGNQGSAGSGSAATVTPTNIPPVLTVSTSNSDVAGEHLVAANGMTLYKSSADGNGVSNCSGQCAVIWPPYTVTVKDGAILGGGAGVVGAIGTITRADGSLQLTYKGAPLYFYDKDSKAGNTYGEDLNGFTLVTP